MISPPRYLIYWINSIPCTRCALVNTTNDLTDGVAIQELVEHIVGEVPFAGSSESGAG